MSRGEPRAPPLARLLDALDRALDAGDGSRDAFRLFREKIRLPALLDSLRSSGSFANLVELLKAFVDQISERQNEPSGGKGCQEDHQSKNHIGNIVDLGESKPCDGPEECSEPQKRSCRAAGKVLRSLSNTASNMMRECGRPDDVFSWISKEKELVGNIKPVYSERDGADFLDEFFESSTFGEFGDTQDSDILDESTMRFMRRCNERMKQLDEQVKDIYISNRGTNIISDSVLIIINSYKAIAQTLLKKVQIDTLKAFGYIDEETRSAKVSDLIFNDSSSYFAFPNTDSPLGTSNASSQNMIANHEEVKSTNVFPHDIANSDVQKGKSPEKNEYNPNRLEINTTCVGNFNSEKLYHVSTPATITKFKTKKIFKSPVFIEEDSLLSNDILEDISSSGAISDNDCSLSSGGLDIYGEPCEFIALLHSRLLDVISPQEEDEKKTIHNVESFGGISPQNIVVDHSVEHEETFYVNYDNNSIEINQNTEHTQKEDDKGDNCVSSDNDFKKGSTLIDNTPTSSLDTKRVSLSEINNCIPAKSVNKSNTKEGNIEKCKRKSSGLTDSSGAELSFKDIKDGKAGELCDLSEYVSSQEKTVDGTKTSTSTSRRSLSGVDPDEIIIKGNTVSDKGCGSKGSEKGSEQRCKRIRVRCQNQKSTLVGHAVDNREKALCVTDSLMRLQNSKERKIKIVDSVGMYKNLYKAMYRRVRDKELAKKLARDTEKAFRDSCSVVTISEKDAFNITEKKENQIINAGFVEKTSGRTIVNDGGEGKDVFSISLEPKNKISKVFGSNNKENDNSASSEGKKHVNLKKKHTTEHLHHHKNHFETNSNNNGKSHIPSINNEIETHEVITSSKSKKHEDQKFSNHFSIKRSVYNQDRNILSKYPKHDSHKDHQHCSKHRSGSSNAASSGNGSDSIQKKHSISPRKHTKKSGSPSHKHTIVNQFAMYTVDIGRSYSNNAKLHYVSQSPPLSSRKNTDNDDHCDERRHRYKINHNITHDKKMSPREYTTKLTTRSRSHQKLIFPSLGSTKLSTIEEYGSEYSDKVPLDIYKILGCQRKRDKRRVFSDDGEYDRSTIDEKMVPSYVDGGFLTWRRHNDDTTSKIRMNSERHSYIDHPSSNGKILLTSRVKTTGNKNH